jgi:hypothetical protein
VVIDAKASIVLGSVDPRDYVFGVLDSAADALWAAQRLNEVGFDEADVVVVDGAADSPDSVAGSPEGRFVTRLFAGLKALRDPGAFQERYLEQLHLGHSIVHVYAPTTSHFERAVSVLEQLHAHVP